MTLSSESHINRAVGNGATSVYSYGFRIFSNTELKVTTRDTANIETLLALTTDYSVTGVGSASGGSITLVAGNLTNLYNITIRRNMPATQTTSHRNQGEFNLDTLEDDLDKARMVDQTQQFSIDRSIKLPEAVTAAFDATLPEGVEDSANKILSINADSTGLSLVAGFPTSGVTITSFGESLIDDANAAAARATLSVPLLADTILDTMLDAEGDIIFATANDTPAKLSIGAFREVLTVDSSDRPSWEEAVSVVVRSSTAVRVVNNSTQQTLYTALLPGGAIGTTRKFRVSATGDMINNTGSSDSMELGFELSGVTIVGCPVVTIPANAGSYPWDALLEIVAVNHVQIQDCHVDVGVHGVQASDTVGVADVLPRYHGHETLTWNSGLSANLVLYVNLGSASANLECTMREIVVELV